jgi:FHA domain
MAKIHYTTPEGEVGEFDLTLTHMPFGRAADNAIILEHDSLSSHHGEFVFDGAAWYFTDLDSTNGTYVGTEAVQSIQLDDGGAFTIGHVQCVFVGDPVYAEEEVAYADEAASATYSSTPPPASGYGATAVDRSRRRGFGPHGKAKPSGYMPLYLLGGAALAACAYAIFNALSLQA